MDDGSIVFAFLPDLTTATGVYTRLLQGGVAPDDISLLTHHEFVEGAPRTLPGLSACRGGLAGHGPLLARLDGESTVFEALAQTLLGATKKTGTIKASLVMGETLIAVQARSPADLDFARRTLDPGDGIAA